VKILHNFFLQILRILQSCFLNVNIGFHLCWRGSNISTSWKRKRKYLCTYWRPNLPTFKRKRPLPHRIVSSRTILDVLGIRIVHNISEKDGNNFCHVKYIKWTRQYAEIKRISFIFNFFKHLNNSKTSTRYIIMLVAMYRMIFLIKKIPDVAVWNYELYKNKCVSPQPLSHEKCAIILSNCLTRGL